MQKRYNWSQWFAKGGFILYQNLDYFCTTASMIQQVRNAACRRGIHLKIVEEDYGFSVLVAGRLSSLIKER